MLGIPEYAKENEDLIDLLKTSFQRLIILKNDMGTEERVLEIDTKRARWQLHNVAANTLGRFALEVEEFERKAKQAEYHMSMERAKNFAENIYGIADSYMYSIDAKSSESISDENNNIPTLTDKIKSNVVTRRYVAKDEAAKGIAKGWMGKDKERDSTPD